MKQFVKYTIMAVALILGLTACYNKSPKPNHRTIDRMIDTLEQSDAQNQAVDNQRSAPLPRAITASLLPKMDVALPKSRNNVNEKRFDIAVKDVPAKEFFMGLVTGTPYSVVVSPKVQGTISLNLKNVTVEDVLHASRDAYGFEFERTSYGFHVMPAGLITRVFHVNYLNIKRSGQSLTRVTSGQLTETNTSGSGSGTGQRSSSGGGSGSGRGTGSGSSGNLTSASVGTEIITEFWPELETTLKAMISDQEGRSVVVSPQAGIVVVRAYPEEVRAVETYLTQTEANLNRQVILEAKILEVKLNDGFQSGIDWTYISGEVSPRGGGLTPVLPQGGLTGNPVIRTMSQVAAAAGSTYNDTSLSSGRGLTDFNGIFAMGIDAGNFSGLIKLLSTQGNVQVLSSPRISTVNNQKAVIKVGKDEFFVTEVSGNTSQGASTTTQTQNVELTPFFSGISLDVTPHIDRDGTVILHIHPTVSEVQDNPKSVTVQNSTTTLPLALSSIRESDNIVRAKNGQVVVIGGLMQTSSAENIASTPLLGDIPVIGAAFRRTQQIAVKSELVILLRPIVVARQTWTQQMRHERELIEEVRRGFHVGGKPQTFGTAGEFEAH